MAQDLNARVEAAARRRGALVLEYREDDVTPDMFAPAVLICHVPYRTIYKVESRGSFLLQLGERRVRIQCHAQDSTGTADEKFPYYYLNGLHAMPEREVVYVLDGRGARVAAVNYFVDMCAQTTIKAMAVYTLAGFEAWFATLPIRRAFA